MHNLPQSDTIAKPAIALLLLLVFYYLGVALSKPIVNPLGMLFSRLKVNPQDTDQLKTG